MPKYGSRPVGVASLTRSASLLQPHTPSRARKRDRLAVLRPRRRASLTGGVTLDLHGRRRVGSRRVRSPRATPPPRPCATAVGGRGGRGRGRVVCRSRVRCSTSGGSRRSTSSARRSCTTTPRRSSRSTCAGTTRTAARSVVTMRPCRCRGKDLAVSQRSESPTGGRLDRARNACGADGRGDGPARARRWRADRRLAARGAVRRARGQGAFVLEEGERGGGEGDRDAQGQRAIEWPKVRSTISRAEGELPWRTKRTHGRDGRA